MSKLQELKAKYNDMYKKMFDLGETGDTDVLFEKLRYEAQVRAGIIARTDTYKVPEDFDFATFNQEYAEALSH